MLWVADNNTFCSCATATDLWSAPLTCAKLWAHKSFVTTATWLPLWNPCKNRISVSSTLKEEASTSRNTPQNAALTSLKTTVTNGFFSTAKLIAGLNFNEKQFGYEMNKLSYKRAKAGARFRCVHTMKHNCANTINTSLHHQARLETHLR